MAKIAITNSIIGSLKNPILSECVEKPPVDKVVRECVIASNIGTPNKYKITISASVNSIYMINRMIAISLILGFNLFI